MLKERSPLAPDLKGLESDIRDPPCVVSMDMSYQAGPDGQGQSR
jgi:hypothetical protein